MAINPKILKHMKKITLLLIFCLAITTMSYGQCTTSTGGQWPSATVTLANTGGAETIAANNWPNAEFSIIEGVLPGSSYTVAATPSAYITVTNTADASVITHGAGSVSFTAGAGVTGLTIFWHLDAACGVQGSGDTVTTIQCTSCVCPATAAPGAATAPTPADGAIDVALEGDGVAFSWVEDMTGDVADSFTISIGTTATGDDIGSLADVTSGGVITFGATNDVTYYWKIEAVNCFGSTTSAVWSFTTGTCTETAAPVCATVFTPADNEPSAQLNGADGALTFTWDDVPNATSYELFINGNTQGARASGITFTGFAVSTAYTWSVVPSNCFGAPMNCATWNFTTSATLGVEDNTFEAFSVYPNPTSSILNIKSSQDVDNITVFNLLGQNVASFTKNEITNSSIDMSELSKGLYLVKITSGDKTQTLRVTKE